ncbi:MAG: DUF4388 domain-containing protein, partial [Myxococcota bacterium]
MTCRLGLVVDPDGIEIASDGSLQVSPGVKDRLRERKGSWELAVNLPELLMLRSGGDARVQMAGEILNRMSVMEMINIVATSNWRGELFIVGNDDVRTLSFDQGALKGARSTAPDDRLGEVLYRAGAITREQKETLAREIGEKRFGELAVDRGFVDAQQLFQHLQRQAEDIFFGSLLVAKGFYVFLVGGEEDASATTVHLSVQGLLMEGVQRIDEMALFRDKIPSSDLCPVRKPDAPEPRKLDDSAKEVLELCDGERTIDDIARDSGLGEFSTTKAVYHLLSQKQVTLHAPSRVDPDKVRGLVKLFNEVLQDIFFAVATYGGLAHTRATLLDGQIDELHHGRAAAGHAITQLELLVDAGLGALPGLEAGRRRAEHAGRAG